MRFLPTLAFALALLIADAATAQVVPGGPVSVLQDRIRCTNDANFMTAFTPLEVEIRDSVGVLLTAAFVVNGPVTLACANVRYRDQLPPLVLRFLFFHETIGRVLFWRVNLDTAEVIQMEDRAFSERYFDSVCTARAELQLAPLRDPRSFYDIATDQYWAMDQLFSDQNPLPVPIYRKTVEEVCVQTQSISNRFWLLVVVTRPIVSGPLSIQEVDVE